MSSVSSSEIVVIGGGAVGLGVAYALAKAGKRDIVLIEREADVAAVTTSQGAGLAGQLRSSLERTQLAMHSVATFRELEKDPVARPGWRPVGSLRIAETAARAKEFDRLLEVAKQAGLEVERVGPTEVARLWPGLDVAHATSILWCPTDGYMHPPSVARAYAHQCRQLGVRIETSTAVREIALKAGRVDAVVTNRGRIECRYAVNAAGAHAYHVARLAGLELPIVPVRHEYFVSAEVAGVRPEFPCFRLPDATLYGRPSDNGVLLGGWEPTSLGTDPRSYPLSGSPPTIETDLPLLTTFTQRFAPLLPGITTAPHHRIGKGWPTFTPDGRFILGESCRVPGFVLAGGCNAHGISGSGGIGKLLVEALLDPKPSAYVRSLSPDRFTETPWDWETATREAKRVYETYYALESC